MPLDEEFVGEHLLKGFEEPLRVFKVSLGDGHRVPGPREVGSVGRCRNSLHTDPQELRIRTRFACQAVD